MKNAGKRRQNVMVSSTSLDLPNHRAQVLDAILGVAGSLPESGERILVGDEPYYARADFKRIEGKVLMPGPFDQARMLFRELKPGAAKGLSGLILPPHRS